MAPAKWDPGSPSTGNQPLPTRRQERTDTAADTNEVTNIPPRKEAVQVLPEGGLESKNEPETARPPGNERYE
eukprot:2552363-Prorocentrum_lima.AAC.1